MLANFGNIRNKLWKQKQTLYYTTRYMELTCKKLYAGIIKI